MRGSGLIRLISRRVFTRYNNAILGKSRKRSAKRKNKYRIKLATEIIKGICG